MIGGVVGKLGATCATIFMPGCRMKSLLWEGLADGWTGAQRIYLGERQTLATLKKIKAKMLLSDNNNF